jgi:hypothetical protein
MFNFLKRQDLETKATALEKENKSLKETIATMNANMGKETISGNPVKSEKMATLIKESRMLIEANEAMAIQIKDLNAKIASVDDVASNKALEIVSNLGISPIAVTPHQNNLSNGDIKNKYKYPVSY